jgi:hypothetical protein
MWMQERAGCDSSLKNLDQAKGVAALPLSPSGLKGKRLSLLRSIAPKWYCRSHIGGLRARLHARSEPFPNPPGGAGATIAKVIAPHPLPSVPAEASQEAEDPRATPGVTTRISTGWAPDVVTHRADLSTWVSSRSPLFFSGEEIANGTEARMGDSPPRAPSGSILAISANRVPTLADGSSSNNPDRASKAQG